MSLEWASGPTAKLSARKAMEVTLSLYVVLIPSLEFHDSGLFVSEAHRGTSQARASVHVTMNKTACSRQATRSLAWFSMG